MKSFISLSSILDETLQKRVEILFNNKPIRKGIFILYTVKDYHLTLILKTPTSNKTYDILYPFDVHRVDNDIILDYRVNSLARRSMSTTLSALISSRECNKFLDNTLTIRY